jgi:hypothetical protein
MSYIKFQDDPIAQRFNKSYANLCAGDGSKKVLKILDRCFTIFNKTRTEGSFCDLEGFVYPVDGHMMIDFEVCAEETLSIYNNQLDEILSSSPSGAPLNYPLGNGTEYMDGEGPSNSPIYYILQNDRNYTRGCLLYIHYPSVDKNGDDILPANMNCTIDITDRLLQTSSYPVGEFFSHFSNPVTRNANNLINKIEITNPNLNFSVKVKGMIIYVKSNSDPADCAC